MEELNALYQVRCSALCCTTACMAVCADSAICGYLEHEPAGAAASKCVSVGATPCKPAAARPFPALALPSCACTGRQHVCLSTCLPVRVSTCLQHVHLLTNATMHIATQLYCRYYMKCTGMNQTTIEQNTCRDFFMTPEDAREYGLIDGVIAGADDVTPPPSMVRSLREVGILDDLAEGILRVDCL